MSGTSCFIDRNVPRALTAKTLRVGELLLVQGGGRVDDPRVVEGAVEVAELLADAAGEALDLVVLADVHLDREVLAPTVRSELVKEATDVLRALADGVGHDHGRPRASEPALLSYGQSWLAGR
jgi:hypothetical protein